MTGLRMKSGFHRILRNGAILKGNRGGPVFDRNSNVIGIAVTGCDSLTTAHETENHGIIPVEALKLIGR